MGSKSQGAEARKQRIRELKRQIRNGTYEVDYERLAELLADELLTDPTEVDSSETD